MSQLDILHFFPTLVWVTFLFFFFFFLLNKWYFIPYYFNLRGRFFYILFLKKVFLVITNSLTFINVLVRTKFNKSLDISKIIINNFFI